MSSAPARDTELESIRIDSKPDRILVMHDNVELVPKLPIKIRDRLPRAYIYSTAPILHRGATLLLLIFHPMVPSSMENDITQNATDARVISGLRAQASARAAEFAAGHDRVGWKAGAGTAAGMAAAGTDAPLLGFLTTRTRRQDGASLSLGGISNPMLEPELAVMVSADLAPGASRTQAAAAISNVGPAIEVIDLGGLADLEAVLAGNVFHRAFWLGDLKPVGADVDALRMRITIDGQQQGPDIDPRNLLGAVGDVLRALADQMPLTGDCVRAGDVIITGSVTPPIAVTDVRSAVVTLQQFGSVRAGVDAMRC